MPKARTQSTKKMAMELFFSSSAEPLSGRTGSGERGAVVVFITGAAVEGVSVEVELEDVLLLVELLAESKVLSEKEGGIGQRGKNDEEGKGCQDRTQSRYSRLGRRCRSALVRRRLVKDTARVDRRYTWVRENVLW
uniref:Uncharacterized protein n=1 Tax=Timema bartmani TaxID=61472 RepID=A0A7R9HZ51_9NEOP|nr:unnamed protein product [Timema bartmani]